MDEDEYLRQLQSPEMQAAADAAHKRQQQSKAEVDRIRQREQDFSRESADNRREAERRRNR